MAKTTVLLVRHGETDHNKGGVYQGRLDVKLNDKGRDQAKRLSSWLEQKYVIKHIYSSPLSRAFTTAEIIASGQQCETTSVFDLQEIDVGEWQGLTGEDAKARYPEVWQKLQDDILNTRRPGGESYLDLYERVSQCVENIVKKHGEETICVVCHGGCVRTMLAHAMRVPPATFSFVSGLVVDNTGLSILQYDHSLECWQVKTINSVCHLN